MLLGLYYNYLYETISHEITATPNQNLLILMPDG